MTSPEAPKNSRREFLKTVGVTTAASFVVGLPVALKLLETNPEQANTDSGLDKNSFQQSLNEEKEKEYKSYDNQIKFLQSLGEDDLKNISEKRRSTQELITLIEDRFNKTIKPTPETEEVHRKAKHGITLWFRGFEKENKVFKEGDSKEAREALEKDIVRQVEYLNSKKDSIIKPGSSVKPPDSSRQ